MDNQRLFLWIGLAIIVWITWRTWVEDYGPQPATPPVTEETRPAAPRLGEDDLLPDLFEAEGLPTLSGPELPLPEPEAIGERIRIVTDVLDVDIALRGGDLVRADLPRYPWRKDQPDVPVRLLSPDPENRFVFQTGLRRVEEGPEPNHLAYFEADRREYRLEPGQNELNVILAWQNDTGVRAYKIYTFRRGQYRVDLEQRLVNATDAPWAGAAYLQLQRRHRPPGRSMFSVDSYSFTGPVLSDGRAYSKLSVSDITSDPAIQTVSNGWLAAIQHHFLAAAVPTPGVEVRYRASARDNLFTLNAVEPVVTVAPGQTHSFKQRLFVGPKLQSQLRETADALHRTVDYGVLTILAEPLFWLIDRVHDFVRNWGLAIITVTALIKLAFWKLTAMSGRSMAKMRKLQPRLKALQERYKDDRQALSKGMMDLYKREKVNPAAGCLPILIQMPFFFAFYWVLLESVEMRQAPFALWITDLSSRDPFFVLPLLMGAAMWFQQRLNPAPPDPVQAKIMQFLPIIFTVFFAFFPAGLVLYWLTNTLLSAMQQWRINHVIERDSKA
jgi:YidC/Oxa1 family membrane protein insertase